jgi:glycosyltransferase involved in cell wall biosynthesis
MKPKDISVAVVIPTYMRSHILEKTIPTYFQEYVKEVVLIADGEQDLSKYSIIVQKLYYLAKEKGIKFNFVMLKYRVGGRRAINFGVNKITSEYFLMSNDDIILHPNCIKTLVEKFIDLSKKEKVGAVVPKLINHDGRIVPIAPYNENIHRYISPFTGEMLYDFYEEIVKITKEIKAYLTPTVYLTKKSIFKEIGGYNEKYSFGVGFGGTELRAEDELNICYYKKGYSIYYIPSAIAEHLPPDKGGWSSVSVRNRFKVYLFSSLNHFKFLKYYKGVSFIFPMSVYVLKGFFALLRSYVRRKIKRKIVLFHLDYIKNKSS